MTVSEQDDKGFTKIFNCKTKKGIFNDLHLHMDHGGGYSTVGALYKAIPSRGIITIRKQSNTLLDYYVLVHTICRFVVSKMYLDLTTKT